MIQTTLLTKKFGKKVAVDNLNLSINEGEIYGFLGPNGAGKTTTIRMLLGLATSDSGKIFIHGKEIDYTHDSYKSQIGVLPEKHPSGMWKWMNAVEYLELFCHLYGLKNSGAKINALLEQLELEEHKLKPIRQYSKGMMQKLSFARAIIHEPEILLLDEPLSGLDPYGIHQMRDLILLEHKKGKTILVSSHQLSEIEKFCTRIGIIYSGKLVKEDSTKRLIDSIIPMKNYSIELDEESPSLLQKVLLLPFVLDGKIENTTLFISVDKEKDHRKDISKFLYECDVSPLSIKEETKTLEEAFLSITDSQKNTTRGSSL
ncbi:MAG: ABC transporter ATP-binding protein [Spirochaetia bacterium]|nr:ABC transporter ATP-binding protein [Spirochaetia bacterium]